MNKDFFYKSMAWRFVCDMATWIDCILPSSPPANLRFKI
jgi:hypothetical protein